MNQHAAEQIAVAATMETARRRTRRWKVVVAVVILAGVGREVANRVELPQAPGSSRRASCPGRRPAAGPATAHPEAGRSVPADRYPSERSRPPERNRSSRPGQATV